MLLMIDNYDSFTFTLVGYFESLGQKVLVKRNDEITVNDIAELNPDYIVISPGPCSPNEAGISLQVIAEFYDKKPILGVCLGYQAIAQHFGAIVKKAEVVMHGKVSEIQHNNQGLFQGLPPSFNVTRYHSLIVESATLPDTIKATAWVKGEPLLMALQHSDYPVMGVQFHPESVMSEHGLELLNNFLINSLITNKTAV